MEGDGVTPAHTSFEQRRGAFPVNRVVWLVADDVVFLHPQEVGKPATVTLANAEVTSPARKLAPAPPGEPDGEDQAV